MIKFKDYLIVKIIAFVLITTFITLDISWAYPAEENTQAHTLALWSSFQQSIFVKEAGSALVIRSIAANLFGDQDKGGARFPLKDLAEIVMADLGKISNKAPEIRKALETIDISHVTVAKWENGQFVESQLERDKFIPSDAILLIPYKKNGTDRIIQIALKESPNAKYLIGEEATWLLDERFVVRDVPKDWKGPAKTTVETKEAAKVTITEPIAEINLPETTTKSLSPKRTFNIKAIIISSLLITFFPLSAYAGTENINNTSLSGDTIFWIVGAIVFIVSFYFYIKKRLRMATAQPIINEIGTLISMRTGFSKIYVVDKPGQALFSMGTKSGEVPDMWNSALFINTSIIRQQRFIWLWENHKDLLWQIMAVDLYQREVSVEESESINGSLQQAGYTGIYDPRAKNAFFSEINRKAYPKIGARGVALETWFYQLYPDMMYAVRHLDKRWLIEQCRQYLAKEYAWMSEGQIKEVTDEIFKIDEYFFNPGRSKGVTLKSINPLAVAAGAAGVVAILSWLKDFINKNPEITVVALFIIGFIVIQIHEIFGDAIKAKIIDRIRIKMLLNSMKSKPKKKFVEALLKITFNPNGNVEKRINEIWLQKLDLNSIALLEEALRDKNSKVEKRINEIWLQKLDRNSISLLVEVLRDKNSSNRLNAITILEKMAIVTPEVSAALIEVLKDDNIYIVQRSAKIIGEMRIKEAADTLIEVIKHYFDFSHIPAYNDEMRRQYILTVQILVDTLISKIQDRRSIDLLVNLLQHTDSEVRSMAAYKLDELKWQAQSDNERIAYLASKREWNKVAEFGEASLDILTNLLKDRWLPIQKEVVETLGKVRGARAEEIVRGIALNYESVDVRLLAIEKLTDFGNVTSAIEASAILMKWDNVPHYSYGRSECCKRILNIIGKMNDPRATEVVLKASEDNDAEVALFAVETLNTLGKIQDNRLIKPLVVIFGSNLKFQHRAEQALNFLRKITNPRLVDSLATALSKVERGDYVEVTPLTTEQVNLLTNCLAYGVSFDTQYIPAVLGEGSSWEEDPYGQMVSYTSTFTVTPARLVITVPGEKAVGPEASNLPIVEGKKSDKIARQYAPDVKFWNLETSPFGAHKKMVAALSLIIIKKILADRSWMWNSIADYGYKRSKVIEKIKLVQSRIPAILATLYENNIISADTPLVSIYLMGSYPWSESPNDIDLIIIVDGEKSFTRISGSKLSVTPKEIVPGLETSFEVVGLETLRKAARGEDFDKSKVIRRKLVTYSGAIPLAGIDIFRTSQPPLENYNVMRNDLIAEAELARWENIKGDVAKIEAKKRWRAEEAAALKTWIEKRGQVPPSTTLHSINPLAVAALVAGVVAVLSWLKDFAFTYLIFTGIIVIGVVIPIVILMWPKFFPASYPLSWAMSELKYGSNETIDILVAKGERAVPFLIKALESKEFVSIHEDKSLYAAVVLGKIKDRRATEALLKCAEETHNPMTCLAAVEALESLGSIKNKRLIKPLIKVFTTENSISLYSSMVNEALTALAKIVEPDIVSRLRNAISENRIVPLENDQIDLLANCLVNGVSLDFSVEDMPKESVEHEGGYNAEGEYVDAYTIVYTPNRLNIIIVDKAQVHNVAFSVMQEFALKKEVSPKELFILVQSKIPESMPLLIKALAELKPLSEQSNVAGSAISAAIAQAKGKYKLSDEETKILWLALTGLGQGMGNEGTEIYLSELPKLSLSELQSLCNYADEMVEPETGRLISNSMRLFDEGWIRNQLDKILHNLHWAYENAHLSESEKRTIESVEERHFLAGPGTDDEDYQNEPGYQELKRAYEEVQEKMKLAKDAKIAEIIEWVKSNPGKNFKGEELHVLNGTGPKAQVVGRIDRGIAERFGFVHETANVVLVAPDGRVILQLRNKKNYDDHLAMYGGHLKVGESHIDGALDEARQESGLPEFELPMIFIGQEGYDKPGDNNRERRSWFVQRLTKEEWEEMKKYKAEDEKLAGADKDADDRATYKKKLTDLGKKEGDEYKGKGEVTGVYLFTIQAIEDATQKQNPSSNLPDKSCRYLTVRDSFQGKEQSIDAFFTPDSLNLFVKNQALMERLKTIILDRNHSMPAGYQVAEQVKQLFEIVEHALNNNRANLTAASNSLVTSLAEEVKINTTMTSVEIKSKIATVIRNAKQAEAWDLAPTIAVLNKSLKQLDADSIVASLIVLAREAKRQNQKLYIGISTDWIPAYNDKNSFQHKATNSLINELKTIPGALRSMGLDNIELTIAETSDELAVDALKKVDSGQIKLSNAVIIASKQAVESGRFDSLRSTDKEERAFIAGIDSKLLLELYAKYGESLDNQLDVDIMELLALTLEVATGKEPPQTPLVVSYDKATRLLILLPSATIIDYDRLLRDVNKGRIQALQAA